ncbi:MAG: RNA polymerase sigma factor [Acidobacteriota bacterium]|nr:RNA polymerase sigma factor [Acidobacteriota bacterium]
MAEPPQDPPGGDRWRPLVLAIQAGVDVEGNFRRLLLPFHPKLLKFFRGRGFPAADAEDLTQKTFVRVYEHIGEFRQAERFPAWLWRIAFNLYHNELRHWGAEKRDAWEEPLGEPGEPDGSEHPPAGKALRAPGPSPEEEVIEQEVRREDQERRNALRAAVAGLPPQMRRCFLLRIDQGRKYREIAELMQISIETVKAHIHQGQIRLRASLTGAGGDTGPAAAGSRRTPAGPGEVE